MLYIVLFLHQTTTTSPDQRPNAGCISYYSYIKPQHRRHTVYFSVVVYRTIPTSNHNRSLQTPSELSLYIVLFLHQTTTALLLVVLVIGLYIVLFLHQTTTDCFVQQNGFCCISYYSYIKPQHAKRHFSLCRVVYRTIPTSNHNINDNVKHRSTVVYRTIPTSNHNI